MSYPNQAKVADRLQDVSLDRLHALREKGWRSIEQIWAGARRDLRAHIAEVYHTFFAAGPWNLVALRSSGAIHPLNEGIRAITARFRDESRQAAKKAINGLYRESILRHAWVLDQTTPENVRVRIPHRLHLFEARQVAYYRGDDAIRQFGERWNTWSDGYYSMLMNNLTLNAMNAGSVSDATDEVDATRVNTPAAGLMDALQRVFAFEAVAAINDAITVVSDANEESDVELIWETRRDLKVCDDCDENEGLTQEEVEDDIPLHPNCHCYWRLVPKAWADLLRSGNAADYALAVNMDAHGIVPNAMVVQDEAGKLAGYTTVEFNEWVNDKMYAVSGGI